jgi:hypothetical protein
MKPGDVTMLQQVKFVTAPGEPRPPHAAAARGRGVVIILPILEEQMISLIHHR